MIIRFVRTRLFPGLAALALLAACASPAAAGTSGKPQQRDPFEREVKKTVKKAVEIKPEKEVEIPAPPLAERTARCKEAQYAPGFSVSGEATPCPYLVREVSVTGVFTAAGGGKGAFLLVGQSGETLIVREGDKLFNGEIAEIRLGQN